jgi:putative sigma-54 modulation protein
MEAKIHAIHFDADHKLTDTINEKLAKLHHYFDKIISTDVFLKLDHNAGQVRDKVVEIKVHIPGHTLFSESTHLSFEEAFDDAFESAKAQILKHKEKQR